MSAQSQITRFRRIVIAVLLVMSLAPFVGVDTVAAMQEHPYRQSHTIFDPNLDLP